MCKTAYGEVYLNTDSHRSQKRVPDSLDLALQAVVNHLVKVLATELRSTVRVLYALNCWAISLSPIVNKLMKLLLSM